MPREGIEGDEWGAYVTLSRIAGTNAGSPTGREPYGDTGLVVVAGVTTCQGGGNTVHRAKGARRWMFSIREVCEMQDAETALNVLRERGRRSLPCTELYRQLFNPSLFELAHGRIYANHGAMTPGQTGRPPTACRRPGPCASSMRCATSATGSSQSSGPGSRKRTGN